MERSKYWHSLCFWMNYSCKDALASLHRSSMIKSSICKQCLSSTSGDTLLQSLPPSSPLRASCKDWISWSHCFCRSWSSSCLPSSQIFATPCQCSSWAWHSINCICRSASAPTEGKHRSTSETLLNSLVPVSCNVLFVKISAQNENRCRTDLHDGALLHSQDGFCQKQINIKRALYVICPMPIEETWQFFFYILYWLYWNLLISQQKNKIIISIPTLF